MVVIVSDLHISDRSTSTNVDPSAFELLEEEICVNVEKKKDITEVHVVLLGDIFDFVRTGYWAANIPYAKRPWNGSIDRATGMNGNRAEVERQFNAVFDRIFSTANASANALLRMLDSLPGRTNLPTKVTYVVGNHDRVFNSFPSLQQKFQSKLSNVTVTFENRFTDLRYGLLARHGHEWDEDCYAKTFWDQVLHGSENIDRFDPKLYNVMALGEVITAELMSGLIYHSRKEFRDRGFVSPEDDALLAGLMDVNNLRPLSDVFMWLRWFTRSYDADSKYEKAITAALLEALDGVLNSSFAREWDKISGFDTTDVLEATRFALKTGGLGLVEDVKPVAEFLHKLFSDKVDSLKEGARQEFFSPSRDKRIRYIVYGHTHEARHDFFSGDRDLLMYINTGTYLPFIQIAEEKRGFATAHRMTIAFFYHTEEDKSDRADNMPTLQLWNGIRKKNYKRSPAPTVIV